METILKGSKKIILLIILGLVVLCGISVGNYIFLQKYYFFNEKNVYVQREVMERLDYLYSQEFELLSIEFETIKVDTGGAGSMHMWTFTFRDSRGRQFYVYDRISGSGSSAEDLGLDGAFYHLDYYNKAYIDDTYGPLCMEEILGDKFNLQQYRQEKGNVHPYQPDYIFVYTEDNADEIAEILTEMYFKETEFSSGGCLRCLVNNEMGEEMFTYHWGAVTHKLQNQGIEITEETVYAYFLGKMQNQVT